MKVAGRSVLDAFCRRHEDARQWIEHWLSEAEEMLWKTPQHVTEKYASARLGADNRLVFDVNGAYRMEVRVAYRTGALVVQWAGTHLEYDERNR